MGYLVFEGNAFYEIDEECIRNKNVSEECDVKKYLESVDGRKDEGRKDEGRKDDNHDKKI